MALSKQMIEVKTTDGKIYEERTAGEAGIYPGMVCKVNTSGYAIKHNGDGEKAECLIAIEDSLQGKTVSDVYTSGYPVRLVRFRPGEEFLVLLEAGATISIGERLVSVGNGCVASAEDSGSAQNNHIAIALEAEDLSGLGAVNTLIHARAVS